MTTTSDGGAATGLTVPLLSSIDGTSRRVAACLLTSGAAREKLAG